MGWGVKGVELGGNFNPEVTWGPRGERGESSSHERSTKKGHVGWRIRARLQSRLFVRTADIS